MSCTVEEVVASVQFILGFPDESVLPASVITTIVNNYVPYYDLTDHCCELTYFSAIASMEFLIKKLGGSGEGIGGSRIEEREGSVQVKQEFNKDGLVDFWKDELKRFKDHPSDLLPCMRDVLSSSASNGYIVFGGVSKEEVDRVNSDSDSYNAIDEAFEDIDYQIGLPNRTLRG